MTPNEARDFIYEEWIANWPGQFSPEVPYTFDNENFNSNGQTEWLFVKVQHLPTGGQHTLGPPGARIFRRRAVVRIQIHAAVDEGLLRLDELATAARNIFEAKTINQVMFHDSSFVEGGVQEDWYVGTLSIFFTYDETR